MRKHVLLALAVAMQLPTAQAQYLSLGLRIAAGHNYAQNGHATLAMLGDYRPDSLLMLRVGVKGGTSSEQAVTAGWQTRMELGEAQLLLTTHGLWRRFGEWHIEEFCGRSGVSLGWDGWRIHLGLASRAMTATGKDWLNESTEWIFEPFNLMYELCYTFRFGIDRSWVSEWRMADFDDFVIDRAYQPLFSCRIGHVLTHKTDVSFRAVLHPTGMFSLSANYYALLFVVQLNKKW